MPSQDKFSLLRTILHTLGLSNNAVDDVVERITDWLSEKDVQKTSTGIEYPYFLRDDFLSPAEHSFYLVLKSVVLELALVCPKVGLSDIFYAKSSDNSKYRTYTNKIDRKHVDFLLCDPKTVRPILGIELDDKSHQRPDRQERDEFVENVFAKAKLPLLRISVKHSYSVAELNSLLQPYLGKKGLPVSLPPTTQNVSATPNCPKCGSEMVLRTAKSGTNQGEKFWGCSNYPKCHGILKFETKV
jgi:predicted RNA-binding Zn-ribbon protein involved in translation (DUF1610 family)